MSSFVRGLYQPSVNSYGCEKRGGGDTDGGCTAHRPELDERRNEDRRVKREAIDVL